MTSSIDYPSTLPEPLIDGSLTFSEADQRRDVQAWAGPAITTPNVDDAPSKYSVTILMSKAQLDEFVDFYKTTLNFGVEFFNMNLSAAGQVFEQEVSFKGSKPSVTQINKLYNVTMTLTTRIAFRDDLDVTNRAIAFLDDGFKYISELPVGDITFDHVGPLNPGATTFDLTTLSWDSTQVKFDEDTVNITWDSTVVKFDNSTNPFY